MAEFKVTEKGNRLSHAHVAISFEADIGNRFSRIYKSHNVFCNDIQPWSLLEASNF